MQSMGSYSLGVILLLSICAIESTTFKLQNQSIHLRDNDLKISEVEDKCYSLLLTPYIKRGEIEEAQKLARVHLNDTEGVESYSGFLTVDDTCGSNLFFWYFPSETNNSGDPLVLWFPDGLGVSSLYGAFEEIGPFYINNGIIKKRKYHWSDKRNVLFIDSSVDSGYSFTNSFNPLCLSWNEDDIRKNLYEGLAQFLKLFPALQKSDLFLFGESYGGKFVAGLAYTIHRRNKKSDIKINLKGLGIGNGFLDPINMLDFSTVMYNVGNLNYGSAKLIQEVQNDVLSKLRSNKYLSAAFDYNSLIYLIFYVARTDINNYVKYYTNSNDTEFTNYFRETYVTCGLHASPFGFFRHYSLLVRLPLRNDYMRSVKPWIEELLEHYPVMLYNGQLDLIVSAAFTQNFIKHLKWSGAEEFQKVQQIVIENGDVIGWGTEYGNLREYRIRNASSMVPKDQPQAMYYFMERFIHNVTHQIYV